MSGGGKLNQAEMKAFFVHMAEGYETQGGETTKAISRYLFAETPTAAPLTSSSIIHDNGCGPGITTGELIKHFQSQSQPVPSIHATDVSDAMINVLNRKGWTEKYGVRSQVMDAVKLEFADESFTHTFLNFAIFALSDSVQGVKEIYRTLKPGSVAYVTTWKDLAWLPIYQNALKKVQPNAPVYQGPIDPSWFSGDKLKRTMIEGGFKADDVKLIVAADPLTFKQETMNAMSAAVTATVGKGWGPKETERFLEAVNEELQKELASEQRHEIVAWCAIGVRA